MPKEEIGATNSLPSGVVVTGNEVDPDNANPQQIIEAAARKSSGGYHPSKAKGPVVEHSPSRFEEGHPQHIGEMERGVEVKHGPAPGDHTVVW